MSDELFRAFDECLSATEAGASLESVLARYPHLAAELRPMLLAAQAARPTEILRVPHQSEEASRQRFLALARELKQKRTGLLAWWPTLSYSLRLAAFLLAVVLGGWGVTAASASALPGEALYPLKRVVEQAQVSLAAEAQRLQLQAEFNQRRIAEIQALLEQRREAEVEFTGVIAQTSGEQWVIASLPIRVPATLQTGFTVGDEVAARARTQTDGSLLALSLRLLRKAQNEVTATPTLTVTPTPTPTATLTTGATATLEATLLRTATRTPSPSRTASPTVTRTASATPTLVLPTSTPPPSGTDDGNDNGNDNGNDDNGNDNGGNDNNDNHDDDDHGDGGNSGPSPSNTPKP
ncbi:MAG: hypothetical protein JNL09_08975 [Anaerolineales bacterium]|nr:hypothetical protein [Anaerolineales bacterium]